MAPLCKQEGNTATSRGLMLPPPHRHVGLDTRLPKQMKPASYSNLALEDLIEYYASDLTER
jgi:hypothetical protein